MCNAKFMTWEFDVSHLYPLSKNKNSINNLLNHLWIPFIVLIYKVLFGHTKNNDCKNINLHQRFIVNHFLTQYSFIWIWVGGSWSILFVQQFIHNNVHASPSKRGTKSPLSLNTIIGIYYIHTYIYTSKRPYTTFCITSTATAATTK